MARHDEITPCGGRANGNNLKLRNAIGEFWTVGRCGDTLCRRNRNSDHEVRRTPSPEQPGTISRSSPPTPGTPNPVAALSKPGVRCRACRGCREERDPGLHEGGGRRRHQKIPRGGPSRRRWRRHFPGGLYISADQPFRGLCWATPIDPTGSELIPARQSMRSASPVQNRFSIPKRTESGRSGTTPPS